MIERELYQDRRQGAAIRIAASKNPLGYVSPYSASGCVGGDREKGAPTYLLTGSLRHSLRSPDGVTRSRTFPMLN